MVASLNNNKLEADITTVTVTQIADLLRLRSKRESPISRVKEKVGGSMAIGLEAMCMVAAHGDDWRSFQPDWLRSTLV